MAILEGKLQPTRLFLFGALNNDYVIHCMRLHSNQLCVPYLQNYIRIMNRLI